MSSIKFVAVEGLDFSGKTTLVQSLKDHYESIGQRIQVYRQPGSTEVGQALREIILSKDMDEATRIMLFVASRMEFYNNVITPLAKDGLDDEVIVLTDRWLHSTIAYNVYGKGTEIDDFYFGKMVCLEQKTDMTIYLNVEIETIKLRMANRPEQMNHFDTASEEVIAKRKKAYDLIVQSDKNTRVIESNQPYIEIVKQAVSHIDSISFK